MTIIYRTYLWIAFIPLFVACSAGRSTDRLLAEVLYRDQSIRRQMVELTRAVTVDGQMELVDSLIATNDKIEQIDARNMAVVDSLLQQGIPSGLQAESYKAIWIVIDHASVEKQVEYLPTIEQMAARGLISSDKYAILFDRVAMKQNRPQRYGSQSVQFGTAGNMQLYLWTVESPEKLDSLRSSVGLQPIADYLRTLTETAGIEAKYDPDITVEELNALRGR